MHVFPHAPGRTVCAAAVCAAEASMSAPSARPACATLDCDAARAAALTGRLAAPARRTRRRAMLFFALKQRVRSVFFGVSFTKRPRHWWPQGRGPRGRQRQPAEKAVCRRASPAPSPRSAGVFLLPIPCSVLPAAAYGFRAALSAGHRGAGRRKVAGGSGAAASDAGRRVHVCRLIAPGAPGDSLACPWPRAACSRRILAADAAPFESPIRGRVMRSTEGAEGCKIMRRAMRAVRGDGFGGSGRGGWAATEGLMDNHAACNACCPGCLCAALASASLLRRLAIC